MSEILVLKEFMTNIINFFDELINLLPEEGDLVVLRLYLINRMPIKDAMDEFNHNINKNNQLLRTMVLQRNESFFIDNDPFGLSSMMKAKTSRFKEIWRSPDIDDNDKVAIWSWMDSFVEIGDMYTKTMAKYNKEDELKE